MTLLRKYRRNLYAVLIVLAAVHISLLLNPYNNYDEHMGITIFFEQMSIHRTLLPAVVYLLIFPSFSVMQKYSEYHNHFDWFLITRKGRIKYILQSLFSVMAESVFFNLLLQGMILLTIHLFWSDLNADFTYGLFELISTKPYENLFWFLITSNIGAALYAGLLFLLIPWFNSPYIFRALSIFFVLASVLIASILFPLLAVAAFITKSKMTVIMLNLNPLGLLTPGIMSESNLFLSFACGAIIILPAIVIMACLYKGRREENV